MRATATKAGAAVALSAKDLREIGVQLGKEQAIAATKPDLISLVTAIDAWCDTNQTSYNNAIPQPFRTNLSATQKAALLAVVAIRRVS